MEENPITKAVEAMEELAEILKKAKKESRLLKFLLWWDDLKFDIKRIFKRKL